MATFKAYVEDLEKELTCCICQGIFEDPKALPCLHSFCLKCITDWYNQCRLEGVDFTCPMCNFREIDLPHGDTLQFRSSFYFDAFLRLLHAMKTKSDEEQKNLPDWESCVNCEKSQTLMAFCPECNGLICEECFDSHDKEEQLLTKHNAMMLKEFVPESCVNCEKSQTLTAFCPECNGLICKECFDSHDKVEQLLTEHNAMILKEFKQENVDDYIKVNQMLCKKKFHEKRRLEYYCNEENCKMCICQKCVTLDHQNHRVCSLEEAAEEIKEAMEDTIRVKLLIGKYKEELEQTKQKTERLQQEIEAAKYEVYGIVDHLMIIIIILIPILISIYIALLL